jgi:hypothetical protein
MRRHLVDGAQRYRRWAEQAEAAAAAATGTATGGKT